MDRIPFIVGILVKVSKPALEAVRLLKVVADADIVCAPAAPKLTVPVPALNTVPVPFQAVVLVAFSLRILLPPFNVPAVRVTIPVKVWVSAVPRFKVPPVPLMVSGPPLTLPCKVAVPEVLVNVTLPVVVKPAIDCVDTVPAIVIPPDPLVKVPALIKSPSRVIRFAPGVKVAPLLIFKGTLVLFPIWTAPGVVIAPVFLIIIPPEATNGVIHSSVVAVRAVAVLY